jgi:hypothetical protein
MRDPIIQMRRPCCFLKVKSTGDKLENDGIKYHQQFSSFRVRKHRYLQSQESHKKETKSQLARVFFRKETEFFYIFLNHFAKIYDGFKMLHF